MDFLMVVGWVEFFTRPNIRIAATPDCWVSQALDPTYEALRGRILHQSHQGIDCDDALADWADDQRIDLGLGNGGIVSQLRKRNHGLRERLEIALWPATVAGKRNEAAHLGDHLVRGSELDGRQPQAAVARDLGKD